MSEWTIEALKEYYDKLLVEQKHYFERVIADQTKAVEAALAAADKAVNKAEEQAKAWQAASNEWRGAMTDREREFVKTDVFKEALSSMNEKIDNLQKWSEHNYGRAGGRADTFSWIVAGAGLLLTLSGLAVIVFGFLRILPK